MRTRAWFQGMVLALVSAFLLTAPAKAQDDSALRRDPVALAQRLLDVSTPPTLPPLTPVYEVGDTLDFWVGKANSDTPTHITATLVAATPNVYLWVEEGLRADPNAMQQFAQTIDRLYLGLRWRGTYSVRTNLPGQLGTQIDVANLLPVPDVDNDPHLYILFASDLMEEREVIHNPIDSVPRVLSPGEWDNEHELLIINTTPFAGMALNEDVYLALLMRGIYNFVVDVNAPEQARWLREGLSAFLALQLGEAQVTTQQVTAYLLAPETPLLRASELTTVGQTSAAQLLFFAYFAQRYGVGTLLNMALQNGDGADAVNAALAAKGITDPATGADVSAVDAFADFVMANALNARIGDGRYLHSFVQLQPGVTAEVATADDPFNLALQDQTVNQYATRYLTFTSPENAIIRLNFEGDETTPRLLMQGEGGNHFYWSGRGQDRDHTLTRAFDLRDLEEATLTFDAWYNLSEQWNYGYIEVSTDGGETWDILAATSSTDANRYGVAYGAGFTGVSNPAEERPFPVLGVVVGADGISIQGIQPDGPAADSGLQAGDVVIGYDGELWSETETILTLLANYSPGDTLNLYVQRERERLEIPVVLGAHETRVIIPEPLWLPQEVDLTPYAGQEILVRFEYVSLPNRHSEGFAVDNIAIPQLGYSDDAETESDWEMAGWERVNNAVAQNYLVQVATLGNQQRPARVHQVVRPGDPASAEFLTGVNQGERVVIAISGMNDDTYMPAHFDLTVTRAE